MALGSRGEHLPVTWHSVCFTSGLSREYTREMLSPVHVAVPSSSYKVPLLSRTHPVGLSIKGFPGMSIPPRLGIREPAPCTPKWGGGGEGRGGERGKLEAGPSGGGGVARSRHQMHSCLARSSAGCDNTTD